MNTTDVMVNGLRFSPDCEPQVIGHSKFASMIERNTVGNMFSNEDTPVVQMERDEEMDEE